jgi:hypothetical protein
MAVELHIPRVVLVVPIHNEDLFFAEGRLLGASGGRGQGSE